MEPNKPDVAPSSDPQTNTTKSIPVTPAPTTDPFQKDSEKPVPAGVKPLKKPPVHKRIAAWWRHLNKKQKAALTLVILLVLGGIGYGIYHFTRPKQTQTTKVVVVKKAPITVQSKMTGLPVAPEVNSKQVTAVMIENSPDARPQSGLSTAGFIFEAVAEGGITRFTAYYQDTSADYIGPVRSVRPYYLDVVASFDAAIAHVGGSPEALAQIKAMNIKDLDQFANSSAYQRVGNRAAPHNVYTSSAKLEALEQQKGFTSSNYTGFAHADKEAKAATVTARTVNLNLSSALYNVVYTYEPTTNSYNRVEGGAAHMDEKSGKQLSPKVVIAVETTRTQNGVYSVYGMTGSGNVTIFQNGVATPGTWTRPEAKSQYTFKDANGAVIKLIPGQAWMTLVTAGGVTYAP